MIQIRPISDLRNKFTDIEDIVKDGQPVYLTENGYGSMVVMSIETFSRFSDFTETALDEADYYADIDAQRMSHEEVFGGLRNMING